MLEGVEFHDLAAKPLLYILERVENRADEITDDDDYDDAEPELRVLLCVCEVEKGCRGELSSTLIMSQVINYIWAAMRTKHSVKSNGFLGLTTPFEGILSKQQFLYHYMTTFAQSSS